MPVSKKSYLNSMQLQLEKAASDKFGAAVETFSKSLGEKLGKPDASKQPVNRNDGTWYSSSYAAALAGPTNFRPKLKFLFKVEFGFSQAAKAFLGPDITENKDFAFLVKQIDRPKVTFEYDEDINMYNFRTKVLKRIQHRELTVSFVDDAGNRVFDFFRHVLAILSPITTRGLKRDNTIEDPQVAETSWSSSTSMAFARKSLLEMSVGDSRANTSNRSAVNATFGQIFDYIRVKQFFVDPGSGLNDAVKMVAYDFINPRVTNFDFDELQHEANDANAMTMVFDFDWMEMVNVGSVGTSKIPRAQAFKNGKDTPTVIPGYHGAPIQPSSTTEAGGQPGKMDGGNKGLSGALGAITDRAVNDLTKKYIAKGVKAVAGNSRFAKTLSQQASSALGDLGSVGLSAGISRVGSLFSSGTGASSANPTEATSGVSSSVGAGSVTASVKSTDTDI